MADVIYAGDAGIFKTCTACDKAKSPADFYTHPKGILGRNTRCVECAKVDYSRPGGTKDRRSTDEFRERRSALRARPEEKAKQAEYDARPERKAKRAEYEKTDSCQAYRFEYRRKPERRASAAAAQRSRRADPDFRMKELDVLRERRSLPSAKAKRNAYMRDRRKTDSILMCTESAREMLRRCILASGQPKITSTIDSLGYSPEQLRQRIEFNFKPGMSWSNRSDWHIDHVKPISAFLAQGVTDPRKINALCNLRPLWKEENASKWAKWPLDKAA